MTAMLAPILLAACGGEANSAAEGSGNLQDSELTVIRKEGAAPPDITQMDIASVTCTAEGDSPKTRVEFQDGGFVLVENQQLGSQKAWKVTVALPELEFTHRDSILPAEVGEQFGFDSSGNISGGHSFGVHGQNPVTYGILFNILC